MELAKKCVGKGSSGISRVDFSQLRNKKKCCGCQVTSFVLARIHEIGCHFRPSIFQPKVPLFLLAYTPRANREVSTYQKISFMYIDEKSFSIWPSHRQLTPACVAQTEKKRKRKNKNTTSLHFLREQTFIQAQKMHKKGGDFFCELF